MRRREFIGLIGGAAACPVAARAQQAVGIPSVGVLMPLTGRLPALIADLVSRRVAVIATPASSPAARAAKAATATIPIVFGVAEDPVRIGLVTNLARPEGNATGIDYLSTEVAAKRLGLLHDLVPKATRIAVLVNPENASITNSTLRDISVGARALALEIRILKASTAREIEAAFAALHDESADALFVANDGFLATRRVQLAILATRYAAPVSYANRDFVEAGGLMSYGTDLSAAYRQVGVYAGRILNGAKPADLPLIQSSKFELVMAAARVLGLTIPPSVLALADEVIE